MSTQFLEELKWRGIVQDISDEAAMSKLGSGETFYVGFDPSAPSLHFGNLLVLMTAIRLGRFGLHPILLFGGATGSIGDPSGKRTERLLLDREVVDSNVAKISAQVTAICDRLNVKAKFVNNLDWVQGTTVLEFLREVGKFFTVNYMLGKDSVTARMESETGISFTEFSYMLLQGFDFLHLFETQNCRIQFGGSDQWGNITAGLELIRKKLQKEAFAFSIPLLLDSQGRKLGKSESGAVFLDATLFSPYRFHQYLLNVTDADVIKLLKVLTFFPQQEIEAFEAGVKNEPEKRLAQKALADSVCTIVHGEAATLNATRSAEVLFANRSFEGLSDIELLDIFADVPSSSMPRAQLPSLGILDLFVQSGLAKSKGEARRLVDNGGAYINNERVTDATSSLGPIGERQMSTVVLRAGKKSYHVLKLTS